MLNKSSKPKIVVIMKKRGEKKVQSHPIEFGCLCQTQCQSQIQVANRGVRSPTMGVQDMTLNHRMVKLQSVELWRN